MHQRAKNCNPTTRYSMRKDLFSALARRIFIGVCVAIVACSSTTSPTVTTNVGRCSSSVVSVAVLTSVTVACDSSTTLTLDAGGASYLVVPQFATDTGSIAQVGYTISASGGVIASPSPIASPFTTASFARTSQSMTPASSDPGLMQRTFDAAMTNRARQVRTSARREQNPSRAMTLTAVPAGGRTRQIQVVSSTTFQR